MNTWMNDPQYLAQVGHTLGGYGLILTAWRFGGPSAAEVAFSLGVLAAGIKEFWYDLRYELPKQSLADSIEDFAFYLIGGVIGLMVVS